MAFEDVKDNVEDLKQEIQNLIDANLRYYKLLAFKTLMRAVSRSLKTFLLVFFSMFMLLFLSIALAIGLGDWLDSLALGFVIVGILYLILAMAAFYMLPKLLEKTVLSRLSKKFLNYRSR